ncbi:omega-3 fatty acid desaturase, partial [Capsicum annuum]
QGRILVLQVVLDGEFQLVAQMETNGAVYSLNAFNGKLLAAINQNIQLYKWASCEFGRGGKLQPECLYHGRVLSLYVRTRGDFIGVGDLVMCIVLLICKQDKEEYVIEQLAYHSATNWMSAVEILRVIASLPQKQHNFLETLQSKLRKVIKGVGELSNEQWRTCWCWQRRRTIDTTNFVDGDLIESFLDLSKNQKEEIAQEMEVPFGDLVKVVEELTTLHSF